MSQASEPPPLGEFLRRRDISQEAAALLAGVNPTTIWKISNGRERARPQTVVKLARALGISARRAQRMCDASYESTELEAFSEPDEVLAQ